MAVANGIYTPPTSFDIGVDWDDPPATSCDVALALYNALTERYACAGLSASLPLPEYGRATPGGGISYDFARAMTDALLALCPGNLWNGEEGGRYLDPEEPVRWVEPGVWPNETGEYGRYVYRFLTRCDLLSRAGDFIGALPARSSSAPNWKEWIRRFKAAIDLLHVVPTDVLSRTLTYSHDTGHNYFDYAGSAADACHAACVTAGFDADYPDATPLGHGASWSLYQSINPRWTVPTTQRQMYSASARFRGVCVFWPSADYPAIRAMCHHAKWIYGSGYYRAFMGHLPDDYADTRTGYYLHFDGPYSPVAADHRFSESDPAPCDALAFDAAALWEDFTAPDGSNGQAATVLHIYGEALFYLDFKVEGGFSYQ